MATGLDIAAGAAQVVSLAFQIFQGCIEAYKFCHTAQKMGPDGDLLRTKLDIERYRLEEWARCSRLDTSSPDARLNWTLIYSILEQQHTILTSAERLKTKYGLSLQGENTIADGDRTGNAGDAGDEWEGKNATPRGLDRILRILKPKLFTNATSTATSTAQGSLARIQWAATGREKVVKVIDDLSDLNTRLERLLDATDRMWVKTALGVLLRNTLSHTTQLAEVEMLQELLRPAAGVGDAAIASAVEFKRIRLILGVDQRPDEVKPLKTQNTYSSMPRLRMLKEKRLRTSENWSIRKRGIQVATYSNEPVIVEWRETTASNFDVIEKQMQALALLLGSIDNTFATLPCLGLTSSKEGCRFALVYETPAARAIDEDERLSVGFHSLYDLMSLHARVSLKSRIGIARILADAVMQLHTAGWLHKSIRSDNVIFLGSDADDADILLSSKPYLMGYDFARPASETALTELPNAPLYTDLYRHPDKRGSLATGYKKSYDLFALGCLLTELALWEHLVDTLSRFTKKDWNTTIQDAERARKDLNLPSLLDVLASPSFIRELCHAVGPKYLKAIQLCLSTTTTEHEDASLEIQQSIIENLRNCEV